MDLFKLDKGKKKKEPYFRNGLDKISAVNHADIKK